MAAVPPGRAVRPPAAARGTHRRLRVGSVGRLAPEAAVLDGSRAVRRRAASGAGLFSGALPKSVDLGKAGGQGCLLTGTAVALGWEVMVIAF